MVAVSTRALGWIGALAVAAAVACGAGPRATPTAVAFVERPVAKTCSVPANAPFPLTAHRVREDVTFDLPTDMAQLPDGSWLVTERVGVIRRLELDGAAPPTVFADVEAHVDGEPGDDGLFSLALSPDFATSHELFLSYTANDELGYRYVISRARTTDDGAALDVGTLEDVLVLPKDQHWHHGGHLVFGPDRMLYVGIGDGDLGDPRHRAQDLSYLFGKFLRLDVLGGRPYLVPDDNPYAFAAGVRPEIWATGFRNPWSFSFDRATGELWAGDVGQYEREELDLVVRGGNYGWSIKEGSGCFGAATCDSVGLIDPVYEYVHPEGFAVIGGFVYRGSALPDLVGSYVFGDWGTGIVSGVKRGADGAIEATPLADTGKSPTSFEEDTAGELYFTDANGGIYRLQGATPEPFPTLLSDTGCVDMARLGPTEGEVPYDVNMELWSEGADKRRWFSLPADGNIQWLADGQWVFPAGSVIVKTFLLGERPIETRLLVNHRQGGWSGYSYAWDADGKEARLQEGGARDVSYGDVTWTFPSRAQCKACHNPAANHVLGLEAPQLNRDFVYPNGTKVNQLDALRAVGLFDAAPTAPASTLPRLPSRGEPDSDAWSRAYLHANCSICHRANGPTQQTFDVRFDAASTGLCNAPTAGTFGLLAPKIVMPGEPSRSVLLTRMGTKVPGAMPPLARHAIDGYALGRVTRWVADMRACPP
jgi:uncharacterized repeat protein (TIGR03806 family)